MVTAFYLLLVIGLLGAFDVIYFHIYRCGLAERAESQREVLWHTARHLIYAAQFLVIANLRLHGAALLLLVLLYAADVFVAWADVWEEKKSRASQGGLPRGEYLMHIVLSVLVGLYLSNVFSTVWPDRLLPSGILVQPPEVPAVLRWTMTLMGVGALAAFVHDLIGWLWRTRGRATRAARRIVVEVLLPAPVELAWQRTQDPEQHLRWDLRFDTIRYTAERDARGFGLMEYATRLGFGMKVRGTGRYLHSAPLRRSTFGFDSEDWKSLIRNGRGVWLYEQRAGGTHFRTVFDYDVRFGWVGAVIDACVFRPLMQRATEYGFETLRRWCAGDERALIERRSRWVFLGFLLSRALGKRPRVDEARSWLGSGTVAERGMLAEAGS